MNVNDIDHSSKFRLSKLLNVLENEHSIKLDFDSLSDLNEMKQIYSGLELSQKKMISESAFNSEITNKEYIRNSLIMEAMRIYISEISPKKSPKSA